MILFHTIGYEKSTPMEFLQRLHSHEVGLVIDVRRNPVSRKRGFSKNQMRMFLEKEGIRYLHMQSLGAPKEIRDRLRDNGAWSEYVKGYEAMLAARAEDVLALVGRSKETRLCLLCFERNPEVCHRSLVSREMEIRGGDANLLAVHIRY